MPREKPPVFYALLHKVYQTYADRPDTPGEYEARVFDFQFHMEECVPDFAELAKLLSRPDFPPSDKSLQAVWSSLIHMLPHLNAAYKALHREPAPDFFQDTPPFTAGQVKHAKARRKVVKK